MLEQVVAQVEFDFARNPITIQRVRNWKMPLAPATARINNA